MSARTRESHYVNFVFDGKQFTASCSCYWGDKSPQRLGVLSKIHLHLSESYAGVANGVA